MEVKTTINESAFDCKNLFEKAIKDFTRQAIVTKMEMNYHKYNRDDAFCLNVLMINEMQTDGFITAKEEAELEKLNRQMNLDWIDNM